MKNKALLLLLITSFILFSSTAYGEINESFTHLNNQLIQLIQSFERPTLTLLMIGISDIGKWFIYFPIACLFLIIPKSRKKIGLPALFNLITTSEANHYLKALFAVDRPNVHRLISQNGFSFPSYHAMVGTAFVSVCVYYFLNYPYKIHTKIFVSFMSFCFLLLVGISRVYLGVHYPSDIIGGYLGGIFMFSFTLLVFQIKINWKIVLNKLKI